MFKLLLLAGASLAPAFTFSHEDRGSHEADIFTVSSDKDAKAILEQLIDEESEPLKRSTVARQHSQDGQIAMTTLQYAAGEAAIAYLYHEVSNAEGDGYICRIRIDPESEAGLFRTVNWCLSFIDPSYRPTVVVPSTKPR